MKSDIGNVRINMDVPIVSVIIVNWNGERWLPKCLDALRAQTFRDFETILVDNNSTDGSIELVTRCYPEVTLVRNSSNDGFAKGNNIGYKYARGRYILLLNNDTEADSGLLDSLIIAFAKLPKAGALQAKLVLIDHPEKLDACGAFFTPTTVLYHFGFGKDASLEIYNKPFLVFSVKGACMMLRREIIDAVGFLDDEFWCYCEETDLCHRLWIAGWECWYWPGAICRHGLGGTSIRIENSIIHFHNFKNKLSSYLKNFSITSLLWVLPMHVVVGVGYSLFFIIKGKWRNAISFLTGTAWVFGNFSCILKKRHAIQSLRKTSDYDIFRKSMRNPRCSYYFYLLAGLDGFSD